MSISIQFENVVKKYGDNVIISGLSLQIKNGEFFTLLGPSGCGKTTLLRMVAGFNTIEGGEIYFDKDMINNLHPSKRNIGMVFQNYAIFPHMTVKENVAFGLQNRKVNKAEIEKRVDEILKTVQIDNLKNRLPQNMSGGQQQRIALARAIVIHPNVLLMDEPLSNLDAKLRVEMRNAIRQIQNSVGITTIYVTHDQEEALAISDRIGVMNKGVLEHVGTPRNIYQRPANIFVANFIGCSNQINAICEVDSEQKILTLEDGYKVEMTNFIEEIDSTRKVIVSVRPEEFIVKQSGEGLSGIVKDRVFLGLNTHYFITLSDGTEIETISESEIDNFITTNSEVKIEVRKNKINVFSEDGSKNLIKGVVNDAS